MAGFIAFVSQSVISQYVKVLRLGSQHGLESKLKLGPSSLAAILASLPALTTLGVYYAWWDSSQKDDPVLTKGSKYVPHMIGTFELVGVVSLRHKGRKAATPLSLDDIRACLRHFTSIGNLTITHAQWRENPSSALSEPTPPTEPVTKLRVAKLSVLSHSMMPSILRLISTTDSSETLRTLLVGISEWSSIIALGEFLAQEFGHHIEDLSLVFAGVCRFLSGQRSSLSVLCSLYRTYMLIFLTSQRALACYES